MRPVNDSNERVKDVAFPMRPWRASALVILLLALFAGVMALEPIAQSAAYHDFADQRFLLGVPNLFDVGSSFAFLIVGALGIALCAGQRRPPRAASWMVFFIGTALTGFGSAYYHWAPNDDALVWDRLPMALAFMALLVALVVEHVGEGLERFLLAPALAVGVMSVIWWQWSGDLRPYLWVQFAPLLCISFVLAMFPARYTHRRFILYAIGLYALAKAAEIADKDIFTLTAHVVSGHTLKHLLAACAIFALLVMLRRREASDV
jgi:Ceramidase